MGAFLGYRGGGLHVHPTSDGLRLHALTRTEPYAGPRGIRAVATAARDGPVDGRGDGHRRTTAHASSQNPTARPVVKRGRTWSYVVDVGRDPVTGRRRQRWRGGSRRRLRLCSQCAAVGRGTAYRVHEGEPKTRSGRRTVSLDARVCAVLVQIAAGSSRSASVGRSVGEQRLRVHRRGRAAVAPGADQGHVRQAGRDLELPRIRFHDLRHTSATLALSAIESFQRRPCLPQSARVLATPPVGPVQRLLQPGQMLVSRASVSTLRVIEMSSNDVPSTRKRSASSTDHLRSRSADRGAALQGYRRRHPDRSNGWLARSAPMQSPFRATRTRRRGGNARREFPVPNRHDADLTAAMLPPGRDARPSRQHRRVPTRRYRLRRSALSTAVPRRGPASTSKASRPL